MSLSGVHSGDIVRAGGGHWLVLNKERGRLQVRSLSSASGLRWIKAAEVECHWRKRTTKGA